MEAIQIEQVNKPIEGETQRTGERETNYRCTHVNDPELEGASTECLGRGRKEGSMHYQTLLLAPPVRERKEVERWERERRKREGSGGGK